MIDLLAVLPLSIALSGPAHDSLASGPQPRDLDWTPAAAFEPVNGDVRYTEKWSAVAGVMEIRTHLRPGRGVTNSAFPLTGVAGYIETRRPDLPVVFALPACCRQGSPVAGVPPETDHPAPVPGPAPVWLILTAFGVLGAARSLRPSGSRSCRRSRAASS